MKQEPLLMHELTDIERVALQSLIQQPGWKVIEKLHETACRRATEAVIKVNPEEEGYERLLTALQSKARERNEFSGLILRSVQYHIDVMVEKDKEDNQKPPENPILERGKRSKDNQ